MDNMGSHPPASPRTSFSTPCPLDDHGALAADAPCMTCGYNLRGLTPASRCPECGTAIPQSLCAPYLRCAPLCWLNRLAAGLRLLLLPLALLPVPWVLNLPATLEQSTHDILTGVTVALITVFGVVAVMKMTSGRPANPAPRTRIAARICLLLWVAATPVDLWVLFQGGDATALAHSMYLGAICAAWTPCALYLRATFKRSEPRLATWVLVLLGASIVAVSLVASGLCVRLSLHNDVLGPLAAGVCCMPGGLCGIGAWIGTIAWVIAARRFVRKEARIAAAWASASGGHDGA